MALGLVARTAVALSDHLNGIYRVLKGTDPDSLAVRLPTAGSFEVRHSVTAAPVLRVTDAGIAGAVNGSQIVDSTITSAKIADDSIVNADVNAAAAIQLAKLNHVGAGNVLRSNGTTNVAGPVVTGDMVANTINADRLLDNSISAIKLGSGITAPAMARLGTSNVLAAPSAVITFGSIPQTYRHLEIRLYGRATTATSSAQVKLQCNGDATAVYHAVMTQGVGTSTTTSEHPMASIDMVVGTVTGAGPGGTPTGASLFGAYTISIPHYTDAAGATAVISSGGYSVAASNGSLARYETVGYYYGTGAITQIQMYPVGGNWAAGTLADLYGLL